VVEGPESTPIARTNATPRFDNHAAMPPAWRRRERGFVFGIGGGGELWYSLVSLWYIALVYDLSSHKHAHGDHRPPQCVECGGAGGAQEPYTVVLSHG
jgi:hypothetical protein